MGMPCNDNSKGEQDIQGDNFDKGLGAERDGGTHTHPSGTAGGLVVTYEHGRGDSVVRVYDWHNIQAN